MKSGINFLMLLRVMGLLVLIEALFMTVPLGVAMYWGDGDTEAFLVSIAIAAASGSVMTFAVRPRRHSMGKREGFLLTAMVWVVFSIFGMIPFMICRTPLSLSDAFFESMSGFTTTGASVMQEIDGLSHGIHMWRSLMQWIGGMGIILFTLAVVPMLNSSGGMQMFNAEVTGITHEKLRPRVSSTAKRLWLVYALLTLMLVFLYWIGPMGIFDSVCHAFSTMSTGGFSTRGESLGAWDSLYIKIVTTVFMFIGGVNFALIFKASTGNFRAIWSNQTFRVYLMAIAVMFVLFDVALVINPMVDPDAMSMTIDPLFQIVSMMSSTGFTVEGFEDWGYFILALTIVLMFFGACAGSTSGGAKIDRAIFLWKNLRNEIYRCVYPNRILAVENNGKTISPEIVNKVLAFLCLYVLVILVGGILLTMLGVPLVDGFFSAFSCVSNTGLETGLTGYGGTYDLIPPAGKWILSMLMLTGRLEIFTVLVLLAPGFWKK
ncbi:MAG: TrkH family potassium uptake protein [Muribaculaceae bacterium]|nr:TrkH family potassium uptake protein [Muribaculaceae bacterium]